MGKAIVTVNLKKRKIINSSLYRTSLCSILFPNYEYVSIESMLTELGCIFEGYFKGSCGIFENEFELFLRWA